MQVNCTPTGIGDPYIAEYPKTCPVLQSGAFPNPASDFIKVTFEYPETCPVLQSGGSGELVYTLYDATGRIISKEKINISNPQSIQFELDVRELPKGIYMLELGDRADKIGSLKIMKQ